MNPAFFYIKIETTFYNLFKIKKIQELTIRVGNDLVMVLIFI